MDVLSSRRKIFFWWNELYIANEIKITIQIRKR